MQTTQITQSTISHSLRSMSRWLMLSACLVLAACASVDSGANAAEQVRQRALERWQALVAGEFTRAYSYNTPGFRAVVTPDGYRTRFGTGVVWLGSEVVDVNCPEAAKCIARLRIDMKPLLSRKVNDKISTHVEETWLFEAGQWWFFQSI